MSGTEPQVVIALIVALLATLICGTPSSGHSPQSTPSQTLQDTMKQRGQLEKIKRDLDAAKEACKHLD